MHKYCDFVLVIFNRITTRSLFLPFIKTSLIFTIAGILMCGTLSAKTIYPKGVEDNLAKSGSNRKELEKVIQRYVKSGDELKLKAAYFLIENMDIHYSSDYYWADGNNKKIAYNELDYANFDAATKAFEQIRAKHPGLHPVAFVSQDLTHITAEFLIDDIENAFSAWKSSWAKTISFKDFCEYILPYRASVEPLQKWRDAYHKKFAWISEFERTKGVNNALSYVSADYATWFKVSLTPRTEPLPRLGALQLLSRKEGPCEDMADLTIFTLRSQGIPVSLNIIPYWATSTGSHFLNGVFNKDMQLLPLDVSGHAALNQGLGREPSKVIDVTYGKQPSALGYIEKADNIPPGFMRTLNYIDVTDKYWETGNISCQLFADSPKSKIGYACVLNGLSWEPAWWGKIDNNGLSFKSMCKGAVYLPGVFINKRIHPAGYPVLLGYKETRALVPDIVKKISVRINEDEKHLHFRPGKAYRLFYWDHKWVSCGGKIAVNYEHQMLFTNIPKNALMLLIPEYSQKNERPFTLSADGVIEWW